MCCEICFALRNAEDFAAATVALSRSGCSGTGDSLVEQTSVPVQIQTAADH